MHRIGYRLSAHRKDWYAEFAASLANSGLAPLTVSVYRHDVGLFLKWFAAIKGRDTSLSHVMTAHVLSYREHLINVARLRSPTIKQRLQAIRCLCRWAESLPPPHTVEKRIRKPCRSNRDRSPSLRSVFHKGKKEDFRRLPSFIVIGTMSSGMASFDR
jgi:Phage integrase, N-terminal SAM-like domain